MPHVRDAKVIVISIWEVDKKKGDSLVGEAFIPLDDPRTIQTNPWPVRGRGIAISEFYKAIMSVEQTFILYPRIWSRLWSIRPCVLKHG